MSVASSAVPSIENQGPLKEVDRIFFDNHKLLEDLGTRAKKGSTGLGLNDLHPLIDTAKQQNRDHRFFLSGSTSRKIEDDLLGTTQPEALFFGLGRQLNDAAAKHAVAIVENDGLAGSHTRLRLIEFDGEFTIAPKDAGRDAFVL